MKNIFTRLLKQSSKINIKSCCLAIIFLALLPVENSQAEESHAFLITGANSKITSVSKYDLRRVYLGGLAVESPEISSPIINKTDIETYKLFLKNIMHMTEHGYKRKVVKRIFRQGSDKIIEISDLNELDKHFKDHPNDICFISEKHSSQMLNIKIIKTLW